MFPHKPYSMEWISIKDRLPEEGAHIIGYCSTRHEKEMHVEPLLYQFSSTEVWAYLFAYNEGYGYADNVTHWMPLPEAPTESYDKIS